MVQDCLPTQAAPLPPQDGSHGESRAAVSIVQAQDGSNFTRCQQPSGWTSAAESADILARTSECTTCNSDTMPTVLRIMSCVRKDCIGCMVRLNALWPNFEIHHCNAGAAFHRMWTNSRSRMTSYQMMALDVHNRYESKGKHQGACQSIVPCVEYGLQNEIGRLCCDTHKQKEAQVAV